MLVQDCIINSEKLGQEEKSDIEYIQNSLPGDGPHHLQPPPPRPPPHRKPRAPS